MLPPEIVRTRSWIVASGALLAVAVPALVWLAIADQAWAALGIGGAAMVSLLVLAIAEGVTSARKRRAGARETGYRLAYDRFVALSLSSLGLGVYAQVAVFVMFAAIFTEVVRDTTFVPISVVGVFNLATAILLVRPAWRSTTVELSPQGIEMRVGFGRRLIPWEALADGGPPRPAPIEFRLGLIVSRPELVTSSGWAMWQGTRERPFILLHSTVHPWFLADSIAWYVANPEERAAIGTEAGQARLRNALSADGPLATVEPQLEPPTGVRRFAVWLTYAGVAFGLVALAVDVLIAGILRDELIAADRAMREMELTHTGEDPGYGNMPELALAWAIGTLVLAMIVGLTAVLLARGVGKGRDQARIPLAVISAIVLAWAVCPFGSPTMSLMDAPGTDVLGGALFVMWLTERGVMALAAIGVLVLLLLPARSGSHYVSVSGQN